MKERQATVLASGFVFPEAPRWHEGTLWFSDMWGLSVHRRTEDGRHAPVVSVPKRPSGLGFLPDGTPLIVSMLDRRLYALRQGRLELFADCWKLAAGDLNDMVTASDGRSYVGNFGFDAWAGAEPRPADLILVEPDGKARIAAHALEGPNGCVLLDRERLLVVNEFSACRIAAFDRLPDGGLANRRIYAELGGRNPDGLCADAEDGLWVACLNTGEFLRLDRDGRLTDRVACPGKCAVACVLGGHDGRTLFCLTYAGPPHGTPSGTRGMIETVRVDIPGFATA